MLRNGSKKIEIMRLCRHAWIRTPWEEEGEGDPLCFCLSGHCRHRD
jgi:hypothetical protein